MNNSQAKRWERIRLLPLVFKPKQNVDGETLESARSVTQKHNYEPGQKVIGPRSTSAVSGGDVEDDAVKYKNYLHGLARANNVKEMQRYFTEELMQTEKEKEKSVSDDSEIENDLLNKLDEKDEENLTALHYAARYGHIDAVKFLVEHGAEINATDNNGVTPLHSVARGRKMTANLSDMSHDVCDIRLADETARLNDGLVIKESELKVEQMIEYLISKGANQQAADNFGQFALHYAATRGNVPAVRALIRSKNTIVDVFDKQDQTPLHVACNHQYQQICELLINAGASVFVKDKRSNTPLHMASTDGNCGIIELLLNAAQKEDDKKKYNDYLNQKNRDFDSPLMVAIGYGYEEAVKLLLDRGANITIKHKKRNSTVHKACSITRGAVNILTILFDYGALGAWRNIDYETPLHTACEFNKPDVVEFLLSKGADIEARDRYGRSPFLRCLENLPSDDNLKIVKTLMDHGASIIAADKQDRTSVILAAKKNNVEALELLLTSDQNYDLAYKVDRQNFTPLHYAAKAGHLESVKCLINRGALFDAKTDDESTALHLAAKNGWIKVVEYILERDTKSQTIRDEDDKSNLPVHLAAEGGHDDIVKLLLQSSSDLIEARNASHQTPLDCASAKGFKSTVDLLLSIGAKINSVESGNSTALHQACKQGRVDMVRFLLERGAYIDSVDSDGFNCLEVAIDNNQMYRASHESVQDFIFE